jgi:hypothetical protein
MSNLTGLLHDTAIKSRSQDALYRAGYAESIARALASFARGPGVVIGLYGEWGSGKSSVKNMILESLDEAGRPFRVVDFNPWQYESAEQIGREFFAELAIASSMNLEETKARERRTRLLKYASRIADVGSVNLSATVPLIGPFALASSKGFEKIGDLLNDGGTGILESSAKKSLVDMKSELARDLATLEKPILVVVDDIDRLTPEEIRLMFKLVRANADFPNVHYLLLFQRDKIERALADDTEIAAAFLEKIVNVGFDLPPLEYDEESKIFEEAVRPILADARIARQLDLQRWERLKQEVLFPSFVNVRQVKRYLNALAFSTQALLDDNGFNGDFTDLAGLEFLRVQEPEVYASLRPKGYLLTEYGPMMLQAYYNDDLKEVFGDILAPVSGDRRDNAERALGIIFPNIDWERFAWRDAGKRSDALIQKRLWRAAFRGGYFGFDHRKVSLSESNFREFLGALESPASVAEWLGDLDLAAPQLAQVINVIESRLSEVPADKLVNLLAGAWKWCDERPQELGAGALENAPKNAIEGLSESILERVEKREERRKLFVNALNATQRVATAAQVLAHERARRDDTRKAANNLFDDKGYSSIRDLVLKRLRDSAATRNMFEETDLYGCVIAWGVLSNPEEPEEWISGFAGDVNAVRQYVERIVAIQLEDQVAGRQGKRSAARLNYTKNVEALERDLRYILSQEPTFEERQVLEMLLSLAGERPRVAASKGDVDEVRKEQAVAALDQ